MHEDIDVHIRRLIAEFPAYEIKCIKKLLSHCANMTFADKSRYDSIFQQVTHKGGESAMNCIKIFPNAEALSVSVENSYLEYQMMHTFLDNFHQGGKYSAQIASHQEELSREEQFTDQKSLSISYLQTDYLNMDSRSGFGRNSERANTVQTKFTFCGGTNHYAEICFKRIRQETEKDLAAGHSDNRRNVLDVDLKIT